MSDTQYYPCKKCGGSGVVWRHSHVMGGKCFSCHGTGKKRRMKRVKVWSKYWQVSCPADGTVYNKPDCFFSTEAEAQEFAKAVAPMHLSELVVKERQTYKIVSTPR